MVAMKRWRPSASSAPCSTPMKLGSIGVSVATGQIDTTRIRCGASSSASVLVSVITAAFDAL